MSRIIEINNFNDHESFIHNNERGVIFFGSVNCPHCHDMVPFFQDISVKYPNVGFAHVEVTKVDVDNVNGVPVFVAYQAGNPVDTVVGARTKSLVNMIETKLL